MKRLELRQIIREVIKEETSIGRKLNESDGKLPKLELNFAHYDGAIPNIDKNAQKILKVLPNYKYIMSLANDTLDINFDDDPDYDYDDAKQWHKEYSDLVQEGFEEFFKKKGMKGNIELIDYDEAMIITVTDPLNDKNVKMLQSIGFEIVK